tara:strand:- start:110 stop:541 length:432 start_codon:yes stop_codon:yes gene_type:complete
MKLDYNTKDFKDLKISELKRIAEYFFRKHLLSAAIRNARGEIFCPLKERWYGESEVQVAHFRDRNHLDTAFDLDNCNLISKISNVWDAKEPYKEYKSLHHYEYENWLRKKIGDKKVDKLLDNTRNYTIFARDVYLKTIDEYRK